MQIPGFEMLDKLGEGGMASVWKARQVSLDRQVAIKILSAKFAADPADVQRFQSEAQSAAKLKHPGIVQVYDANMMDGAYYFVMEFIAGHTVGDWLARDGVISEKDALLVVESVAGALQYAWDREHIVHCDIKPDNVMLDSDGTVKVADLGLARTVSLMARKSVASEVHGTPAYMSPEQARGQTDLDCRTDIYSLGGMLYHMVTGKIPFEGHNEEEVVDMQICKTIADPLDINRNLTKPLCWFIEKMMAKKRENRYKDWAEVLADIKRVKRRVAPASVLPSEGLSTVQRGQHRGKSGTLRAHVLPAAGQPISLRSKIIIAAGVGALTLGIVVVMSQSQSSPSVSRLPPPVIPAFPQGVESPEDRRARESFEYAKKSAAEKPNEFDDAITLYQRAIGSCRGTRYAGMCEDAIRKLSAQREAKVNEVLEKLKADTEELRKQKNVDEAIRIFSDYTGILAKESREKRMEAVAKLQVYKKQIEDALQKERNETGKRTDEAVALIIGKLVGGNPAEALGGSSRAVADEGLIAAQDMFKGMEKCIRDMMSVEDRILESFRAQAGKTIGVPLVTGRINVQILSVRDGKVQGKQHKELAGSTVSMGCTFGVKDLAWGERMSRMGTDEQPGVALAKGLLALEAKAYPHARKYFEKVDPSLGAKLLDYVANLEQGAAGGAAEEALAAVLKCGGLAVGDFDPSAWAAAISARTFTSAEAARVKTALAEYRKTPGDSEFFKRAEPVLAALDNLKAAVVGGGGGKEGESPPPPVPPRAEPVRARRVPLQAMESVGAHEKMVQQLVIRNPQLLTEDVRLLADDQGVLRRVEVESPLLVNISPLRSTESIRELVLGGSYDTVAPLSEIGPLKGMSLDLLRLGQTSVADLAPLLGMSLRELWIGGTQVSSLAPIKNMPLEVLDIQRTNVKDLSPIKGMRLVELNMSETKVFDCSPLTGMPLRHLNLRNTQIKDISFVKDMPLETLDLASTKVYNFLLVRSLPLVHLNVNNTQIKDVAFLRGQRLEALDISDTAVKSIEGLEGMPLRRLNAARTLVRDFSPIQNVGLVDLDVSGCNISDIGFAKNLPLTCLAVENTNVADLSPLNGKTLQRLSISGSEVRSLNVASRLDIRHLSCVRMKDVDLSPLRQSKVESLDIDRPHEHWELLRAMRNLRSVNGMSLKELATLNPGPGR